MPDQRPDGPVVSRHNLRSSRTKARKGGGLCEEITPHVFRRTFAAGAVMDRTPFGKVATALGTTERVVEDVYGRHSPEDLRGMVESLSGRRRWHGERDLHGLQDLINPRRDLPLRSRRCRRRQSYRCRS